ncbi:helix-turn-helix domain-containing protein [Isoptericola sp. NPDC019482]|uniref:helix-turn-helix transcriptional regulator n=1 Tax=Isoptericola sp. NPDC019482 TaxID=3154688 RepID=UPI0034712A33
MAVRTLLRTKDVSEMTGIPEPTLRWFRHTGQGPVSFTLGARRVVYDLADVEKWISDSRAAAMKESA